MLDIKGTINRKYELRNDTETAIIELMSKFVVEAYGTELSVDINSVEKLGEYHAYVDLCMPEIINNYFIVHNYSHIFYISAESVNGYAVLTGPSRKDAVLMAGEIRKSSIMEGELQLAQHIYENLSLIHDIQAALTPVNEIIREIKDHGKLILNSGKTDDSKRLKYFEAIKDTGLFNYEYKYGQCIIEPEEKFIELSAKEANGVFSYILGMEIPYLIAIPSAKPFIRTAYAYYSMAIITENNIPVEIETLLNEYGEIYGRKPDLIKFKNYIDSLVDSEILKYENYKIIGFEKILNSIK
ncbi:MAG: hypothetical protein QXZ44_05330 [Ferroplasma sp.]